MFSRQLVGEALLRKAAVKPDLAGFGNPNNLIRLSAIYSLAVVALMESRARSIHLPRGNRVYEP